MIRVVIAEDQALVLGALAALLSLENDIERNTTPIAPKAAARQISGSGMSDGSRGGLMGALFRRLGVVGIAACKAPPGR